MAFPFAATSIGLSAVKGLFSLFGSGRRKREAQRAIDDYDMQELNNVYRDMPVSTAGSDIIREEANRFSASAIDMLRRGGSRNIFANIGQVQARFIDAYERAAADIDRQVVNREYAIAGDNANIRSMQENRDFQTLAGLGQNLQVARQDQATGLRDLINTGFAAANFFGSAPESTSNNNGFDYKPSRYEDSAFSRFRLDEYAPKFD